MINFIKNWGGVVTVLIITIVLVRLSIDRKLHQPSSYEIYLDDLQKKVKDINAMRYREQATEIINKVIQDHQDDIPLRDLQAHIRKAGPSDIYGPEFRIYHEVAKKRLSQISKERELAQGRGEGLFAKKR